MRKQKFDSIKETFGVLLVVLFLSTVMSISATALKDNSDPDGTWGSHSIANYNAAWSQFTNEQTAGQTDGPFDGTADAQNGLNPNDTNSTNYHKSTTSLAAQALGTIDGWTDGIDSTYSTASGNAYQSVSSIHRVI